ncbi:MAG TPA: DNA recombination protein RmuC [Terriglobales bacterium]|jgi:DNA recombination protein RmuC|nr:DNA recombination protein RmuC [Terriglobales bacterium]
MLIVILAIVQIVLVAAVIVFLFFQTRRPATQDSSAELLGGLAELRGSSECLEAKVTDEMRTLRDDNLNYSQQARQESASDARSLREELLTNVDRLGTQLGDNIAQFRRDQVTADNQFRDGVTTQIDRLVSSTAADNLQLREGMQEKFGGLQEQVVGQLTELRDHQTRTSQQLRDSVQTNFSRLGGELDATNRELSEKVQQSLAELAVKVHDLSTTNEQKQDALRVAVELRLDKLNESNSQKLEQMRQTVDEKLHTTLEKRLTDSFGLVTEQLGRVQLGLGEMKDLANGVGDLKRVLTNVKSRGGFGEVQLGMLLEQMLAPEQYMTNVRIRKDSQESVEYAIRMPGTENGESVLLPVDAKFPREAWERLEDAQVRGDQQAIKGAGTRLEAVIRASAKTINEKYIEPPTTTNFAVMFLPTEGLFAEVVRRPGLVDDLQTTHRICLAGPTTFAALLTSLQMGFRTLAIQKKGSEVWKLLAATKLEFEKFGGLMDKVEKQVGTVQSTLRLVNSKTRTINRRLHGVEMLELQGPDAEALLGGDESVEDFGETAVPALAELEAKS